VEYVEILRARRVLFWSVMVLLGFVVLTALSIYGGHANVDNRNGTVRFSVLVSGAVFAALIVATFIAPGLNAEAATTPIIWTRPQPRDAIAWRYVGVDAATIAIGYVLMLLAILAESALMGFLGKITFDAAPSLQHFVLGLGGALMWYGLVTVAAARLPGRGGLIAGLSWAVFLIVAGVVAAPLPPLLHYIIVALNYLNPFAYVGGTTAAAPFDISVRTALVWAIAIVATVAGVRLWSTREV
jgi:hypothetical protein